MINMCRHFERLDNVGPVRYSRRKTANTRPADAALIKRAKHSRSSRAQPALASTRRWIAKMDDKVEVTCHGINPEPYACQVAHPELRGEFWFSPLGSLITAGARLMLALLDRCISKLHGTYVMEDTDSMAMVATEYGGLVPCPGGPFRMPDGRSAVRALSWREVAEIVARFTKLNPYTDKSRSILKIERDNYDPETGEQRQVYCLAISSKRYALFLRNDDGNPILLQKGINNHEDRWSEHGLGHLRNPLDPESEDRDWIRQAWISVVRRTLSLPVQPLGFEHLPAIGCVPVTRPTANAFVRKAQSWQEVPQSHKTIRLLTIVPCETVWLSARCGSSEISSCRALCARS